MAIIFNFSPTSSHLHPLQVENCGSNSRLVVDEMTMVNSGSKGLRVGVEKWPFCLGFWRPFCSSVIARNCTHFGLQHTASTYCNSRPSKYEYRNQVCTFKWFGSCDIVILRNLAAILDFGYSQKYSFEYITWNRTQCYMVVSFQ